MGSSICSFPRSRTINVCTFLWVKSVDISISFGLQEIISQILGYNLIVSLKWNWNLINLATLLHTHCAYNTHAGTTPHCIGTVWSHPCQSADSKVNWMGRLVLQSAVNSVNKTSELMLPWGAATFVQVEEESVFSLWKKSWMRFGLNNTCDPRKELWRMLRGCQGFIEIKGVNFIFCAASLFIGIFKGLPYVTCSLLRC